MNKCFYNSKIYFCIAFSFFDFTKQNNMNLLCTLRPQNPRQSRAVATVVSFAA